MTSVELETIIYRYVTNQDSNWGGKWANLCRDAMFRNIDRKTDFHREHVAEESLILMNQTIKDTHHENYKQI